MTESTSRSYRPGEWFGIFGPRATVLLPPSEKARVAALWELADSGADFDELLDALLSTGLRTLPAFALVTNGDDPARVLVRGEVRARLQLAAGEEVEVSGSEGGTWAERTLSGIAALQVTVGEGPAEDLPIGAGLVRVSRVDQPPYAPPRPVVEPVEEPVTEAVPLPDVDHDGHTVAGGWDPDRLARPQPGIPGQPPAPPVTAMPVARLVFSSGDSVDVDRAVLVGRAPEARRFTSTEQPRLVTVPSPNQEISSTHLEVRPGSGADHGCAVVTDMGSTNGTVLTLPGLPAEDLQPGIAVQLLPGAVIDLGDGVSIHVMNP